MNLHHELIQKTPHSPFKSSYQIRSADGDDVIMRPTGSAVVALRAIRKLGLQVPAEMNGPQGKQYIVELDAQ